METRERVLEAALKVFAESGYRGATTRRIAQEAGVNEVTLFRYFGSKEELIGEALRSVSKGVHFAALPEDPEDPERELVEWSRHQFAYLHSVRSLIRTCMGECEEHAEFAACATERPRRVVEELEQYLIRLQKRGLAERNFNARVAAVLLLGAMHMDAMGREFAQDIYNFPAPRAVKEYVRLLLRAIGATRSRRDVENAERNAGRLRAAAETPGRARA